MNDFNQCENKAFFCQCLEFSYQTPYHIICVHFIEAKYFEKGYISFFARLSYFDTMTVQAPQPPSPHPSFVPHNLTVKAY